MTNGTAVMAALGSLAVNHARNLMNVASIAGALSLEALQGTIKAFDERKQEARSPLSRQVACAAHLRRSLSGNDSRRQYYPQNIQDVDTCRCMPQVHSAVRAAIDYAECVIDIELNSVTDNPLLFTGDQSGEISVLSRGIFHGEIIAIAMDYLTLAMTELGNISERRLT